MLLDLPEKLELLTLYTELEHLRSDCSCQVKELNRRQSPSKSYTFYCILGPIQEYPLQWSRKVKKLGGADKESLNLDFYVVFWTAILILNIKFIIPCK